MKENKAGIPKILRVPTVIKLIGIIIPIGSIKRLYPYNKNELNTIFFNNLKHFFSIVSPHTFYEEKLFL